MSENDIGAFLGEVGMLEWKIAVRGIVVMEGLSGDICVGVLWKILWGLLWELQQNKVKLKYLMYYLRVSRWGKG